MGYKPFLASERADFLQDSRSTTNKGFEPYALSFGLFEYFRIQLYHHGC